MPFHDAKSYRQASMYTNSHKMELDMERLGTGEEDNISVERIDNTDEQTRQRSTS